MNLSRIRQTKTKAQGNIGSKIICILNKDLKKYLTWGWQRQTKTKAQGNYGLEMICILIKYKEKVFELRKNKTNKNHGAKRVWAENNFYSHEI